MDSHIPLPQKIVASQLQLLLETAKEAGFDVASAELFVSNLCDPYIELRYFDKSMRIKAEAFSTVAEALERLEKRRGPLWRKFTP